MKHCLAVLVFVFVSVGSLIAQTSTTIVLTPTSVGFGLNLPVGVVLDSAPGNPYGSHASNGVAKTEWYVTPESVFGRPVLVGEISSMSYWTKKETTHVASPADWYLLIYTKPFPGDVSTPTWYGGRFGTEPYFSDNMNDPAGSWNQWVTDPSELSNTLRFFESTQGAPGANFGSYTDPDWVTFSASNALGLGVSRANQTVLYLSIQTGSAWATGFTGQIDGLRIQLIDGSVANFNFEPFVVATDRESCKKDGWKVLFRSDGSSFGNQGECVSYVNTGK